MFGHIRDGKGRGKLTGSQDSEKITSCHLFLCNQLETGSTERITACAAHHLGYRHTCHPWDSVYPSIRLAGFLSDLCTHGHTIPMHVLRSHSWLRLREGVLLSQVINT